MRNFAVLVSLSLNAAIRPAMVGAAYNLGEQRLRLTPFAVLFVAGVPSPFLGEASATARPQRQSREDSLRRGCAAGA